MSTRSENRPVSASMTRRRRPRSRIARLDLETLEIRRPLTAPGDIVPGQLYQDVAFYDANWDVVEVKVNGSLGGSAGFTLQLAGGAADNADIQDLNLEGLTAANGVEVLVTPTELTIDGGGSSNKIYSSGYTNIATITASGTTALGSLYLSAAIVGDIALPGVAIGGITLDTGQAIFADTANTALETSINISAPVITITSPITGEAEIFDESPVGPTGQYNPVAGLIDLYNVEAQSIGSIVVNGAISLNTQDPYDSTNTTNDLRGIITVSGDIGSIVAPRSAMRNAIRAGDIGSIQLGRIDGEITTTDPAQATTIALPKMFTGFLNVAGHLNLGFADASDASLDTGNIVAGGGISGTDPSETDPVLVPDKYAGAVVNTSATTGISGIEFNGAAMSTWTSASSIGDVTANSFAAGASFVAATDIGAVDMLLATVPAAMEGQPPTPVDLQGTFKAGGNIGNVTSATSIEAELIAGGNIGDITGIAGGINSTVVLAGGNIGNISVFQVGPSTTQISAGGDIGNIHADSGSIGWDVKAQNIGDILVDSGSLNLAVFAANHDLGDVTVTSPVGAAIEGGSLIAGDDIGQVTAYAFAATAIQGPLIEAGSQAGDSIAGVTGISYGSVIAPVVTAGVPSTVADTNNGIDAAQIIAATIGPIVGQAYVGTGIVDPVIHAQVGDIASITGIGSGDGIVQAIAVAEGAIGPITGQSTVYGRGIEGGNFDANGTTSPTLGKIGQITAIGGPAGGGGINGATRIQAANAIEGITAIANANGGDAINGLTTYATSFGTIQATVLGGQLGSGIVDSNFRAWSDYTNTRPTVQIAAIDVDVRSGLGLGISQSIFKVKGDITSIRSRALNAAAISGSMFDLTQGDIGRIDAETVNSGNAIDDSLFTASNGSIGTATNINDALASGITAIAGGTSILSNGIVGSTFSADANIGFIDASTRGGTAISGSTFTADSNSGNANNGPNLPGTVPDPSDLGALFGIYATTSGQNLAASAAISGSTFSGELISSIEADVTDREEGGAGISGSTFTATNAVYDNAGNFNNEGHIGAITVTDGSLRGNGIENSLFNVGAAGSIGDINVVVLGGSGITDSQFQASIFDYDQSSFSSTIGNINVTTGRSGNSVLTVPAPPNDAWTLSPAGINGSYFAANGGIGNVTVNSIGTGVFYSAFLASFDALTAYGSVPGVILPLLAPNTPGNLGNISITAAGRFGFGSAYSVYAGDNVGNINIRVASRDTTQTPLALPSSTTGPVAEALQAASTQLAVPLTSLIGPAGSASNAFIATDGDLGGVSVANSGAGYASVTSAYAALPYGRYGPVSLSGRSALNMFWAFPRLFPGPTTSETSIDGPSGGVVALSTTTGAKSDYEAGDTVDFTVNFSNPVDVTGLPWFAVNVGSATRRAQYVSGSGTTQLIFSLTIQPGDSGPITILTGSAIQFDLTDRIVEDATGYLLSQLVPGTIDLGAIQADTTPPVVLGVSPIQFPGKHLAVGQSLTVQVTFSEAVLVQGLPSIALTLKNLGHSLVYSGGGGTNTLTFTYVLTKSDLAAAKTATTNGQINLPSGAVISDLAGNLASLPVASPTSVSTSSPATQTAPNSPKKHSAPQPTAIHPKGPAKTKSPRVAAVKSR